MRRDDLVAKVVGSPACFPVEGLLGWAENLIDKAYGDIFFEVCTFYGRTLESEWYEEPVQFLGLERRGRGGCAVGFQDEHFGIYTVELRYDRDPCLKFLEEEGFSFSEEDALADEGVIEHVAVPYIGSELPESRKQVERLIRGLTSGERREY